MGGNSSTPTRIENESTPLPISGKVKIAIACDASDGSGVRVYRFQGTRGELEEGVNWDKTEKEGMTIGQNRTLANFAQDAAAGEIMIICQFEIKLGNDEEDIAYDISRESTDKTMRLFIQKKMAASPQASETGRYKHLDITLRVITYNAHRSLQLSMKALVLSSPLFRMIHWPPAAVDFIMRKTMQSYVEAPSGDDPLRAIANNAGQHSSAESMSSYDIIQFMLAYVTDYAPPYMSVANTEDPQAMLHEFSDRVKGEEYKGLYLYDKNRGTIDPRDTVKDPKFREFVLFILKKFLDTDLSLYGKLVQYNKLNQ